MNQKTEAQPLVRIVDSAGNILVETLDVFLLAAALDTIGEIVEWEFINRCPMPACMQTMVTGVQP